MITSQWQGKKVAFLGDSFTDYNCGEIKKYWEYLQEDLGIIPFSYGVSGHRWIDALPQAQKLKEEHGDDLDAIFLFFGTNDYRSSIPLGEWFNTQQEYVIGPGGTERLTYRRTHTTGNDTMRGCVNEAMAFVKENFPLQQVILLTPTHRAYAKFSEENVQPSEEYANFLGIYHDAYVEVVREASKIWAVPLIDLYSESGLYPLAKAQEAPYYRPDFPDMLHPNPNAQRRIEQVMLYHLLNMPATFR